MLRQVPLIACQSASSVASSKGAYCANSPASGFRDGLSRVRSNTGARTLQDSPDWSEVTAEEAQTLANQGVITVAAHANPGGHGHVATVRPELMPGLAQHMSQAELFNNIGARVEIAPGASAFARTRPVRYYAPTNRR